MPRKRQDAACGRAGRPPSVTAPPDQRAAGRREWAARTPTRRPSGTRRARRRAFTLVEIIVVVTIIALLATLVAPRIIGQLGGAKKKVAQTEVSAIASAVKLYLVDSGVTLTRDFDLEILIADPDEGGGPQGPYLEKADDLIDPWDNPYEIRVPGDINYDFDIISYGPDGVAGTEDDITN